jgi:hypothetical protein
VIPHHNAIKTHCPAGHAYDMVDSMGKRRCRSCMAAADVRRRERSRQLRSKGGFAR